MIISIYYLYIYIYHLHDNCHLIMLHVFYNKRIHKLMTSTSCGFLLTKSSDIPLYYFSFFLHIYDYAVLDSKYREVSDSCGGLDPGDA
jgi:hypothetical protein